MKQRWVHLEVFIKILILGYFLSSCAATGSKSAYKGKNTGDPSQPQRYTSHVDPPVKNSSRYLDSGKKKKKKWTKITSISGTDCPWDGYYKSKAEKKIKSKLKKNRRKLDH